MGENDSIDLQLQSTLLVRQNVTSAKDAPEVVKRLLQPYGGLPADAVMTGAGTNYGEYFQNGTRIAKKPTSTTVTYTRLINGMGIIGDNNRIRVEIGENELLWYFKEWRNYTYIGDVSIISPQTAIEKLKQEELIDSSIHPEDGNITIDMIILGYYAKKTGENDTILEPIWMFYGKSSARSRLGLYVYARQFANFTATPVIATRSEEITFKDISDASPTRRLWDFGDGTNSTLRNPVHAYQKTGTYNISLKVWTDLGSDSLQKINYITYTLSKQ
jgi:PKD repeat protein